MTDQTKIEWCDSTFNPLIGCTKVGPVGFFRIPRSALELPGATQ